MTPLAPLLVAAAAAAAPLEANRCALDVPKQLSGLRPYAAKLGVRTFGLVEAHEPGYAADKIPPLTAGSPYAHFQGVQRLAKDPWIVLSGSVRSPKRGFLAFATLDSRAGRAAFGANRVDGDKVPLEDRVRLVDPVPGPTAYDHAGGIQALGDYLFVPLFDFHGKEPGDMVVVYDVSVPSAPVARYVVDAPGSANVVAAAKLGGGTFGDAYKDRYLMLVGHGNGNEVSFFVSDKKTLAEDPGFRWTATYDADDAGPRYGRYQSINLVRDCSGEVYLLGTTRTAYVAGEDWAELWALRGTPEKPAFKKTGAKHLYCAHAEDAKDGAATDRRACDFWAAGGAYVDEWGRLALYGAEMWVWTGCEDCGAMIRLGEITQK